MSVAAHWHACHAQNLHQCCQQTEARRSVAARWCDACLSLTSTLEIAALAACAAAVADCDMASELDCAVDVTLPVHRCAQTLGGAAETLPTN